MRAFVITGPRRAEVADVARPAAAPGQAVVDVERAGVCGTDVEFFTGEMAYLYQGHTACPVRPGHEWSGTVSAVGDDADGAWLGQRVTGDTMLGCGRCRRCRGGLHWVCADRAEIGIRGGWPGALAEQVAVPVTALRELPDSVDAEAGALAEPGGSALRAVQAAALAPGDRVLVLGPGTIGLLAAQFALAADAEVHVLGQTPESIAFAAALGVSGAWTAAGLPSLPFDAVIDCSNAADLPALALDLVEPGKRIVCVGLAGRPSVIDTRTMVLKDVTAVGILGGSRALAGAIARYGAGSVDPRPLVAATVGLGEVAGVLAGVRPPGAGPGPKILIDPRR
jgi:threonine dehydrogenase-like Zn-dependent dehydrogenase